MACPIGIDRGTTSPPPQRDAPPHRAGQFTDLMLSPEERKERRDREVVERAYVLRLVDRFHLSRLPPDYFTQPLRPGPGPGEQQNDLMVVLPGGLIRLLGGSLFSEAVGRAKEALNRAER